LIVGKWRSGKTGEARALRPHSTYGILVFRSGGKVEVRPKVSVNYGLLVEDVVKFFQTKQPPVPNEESLEVMEFMDAAQRSMSQSGAPVKLH
jgi:hypothetical protein